MFKDIKTIFEKILYCESIISRTEWIAKERDNIGTHLHLTDQEAVEWKSFIAKLETVAQYFKNQKAVLENQFNRFFYECFHIELNFKDGKSEYSDIGLASKEKEYRDTLLEFWQKLCSTGFDEASEFAKMNEYYKIIKRVLARLEKLEELIDEGQIDYPFLPSLDILRTKRSIYTWLKDHYEQFLNICQNEACYRGTKDTKDYILKATSLLPLVYTNNRNKIKGNTSPYRLFLCQFHCEKNNSMRVSITKDFFNCFGCGKYGDQIDYLMITHKINFDQAIYLLAEIFLIYIPENPFREPENAELVNAYRNTLLSEEYKQFLLKAYDNIEKDDETEAKFLHIFSQIERIKRGEYDPDFAYEAKPKKFLYEHKVPRFADIDTAISSSILPF